ncbi:MAG: GNAT family N-acetyltransferase [Armatimonadetes bacterium]|nr:GNAT family N-acetyltransferase [Armatimonadota bacterium]
MIASRPYSDDYDRIMDFLREMYLRTKIQRCWLPQKWEYAEYLVNPMYMEPAGGGWPHWHTSIRIWEEDGRIVAVCHNKSGNDAFLQIRPGYEHLNDRLASRGYPRDDGGQYFNAQYLDKDYIPQLPEGYSFADGCQVEDQLDRQNAVSEGFDHGPAREVSAGFASMEKAPLFRPDLEIMTRHSDGTLSSFCVVWYDPAINIGMFEPVATHPDHRRLGLGREMLTEGLRRLKAIGAERAFVESYGDNRKAFYNSAGFETFDNDRHWTKRF